MACLRGALVHGGEEDYVIRSWDVSHGLPQNTIRALGQTSDGYLWVGTDLGLVRFDGIRFQRFGDDRLPGEAIAHLHVDALDRLWVVMQDGQLGRIEKGVFRAVPWPAGSEPEPVWSLADGAEGLQLGLVNGGLREVLNGDRWSTETDATLGALGEPLRVWIDADGCQWSGQRGGLRYRDPGGQWSQLLEEEEIAFAFPPQAATPLMADSRRGVWVAAGVRLFRFFEGIKEEDQPLPWGTPNAAQALLEDGEGRLWIGGQGTGLHAFDREGVSSLTMENGMPSNHVLTLFEDQEGNIWVGTDGGGLVRIREGTVTRISPEQVWLDGPINSLAQDETHDLWIGTAGSGLIHWDGYRFLQADSFEVSSIRSVVLDPRGWGWIGGEGIGLWKVVAEGSEPVERILHEDVPGLSGMTVNCLHLGRDGKVWVGMDEGLAVIEDDVVRWLSDPQENRRERVRAVVEQYGLVWVGTSEGLWKWEGDHRVRVIDRAVSSLWVGPRRNLWVGVSGGLMCLRNGGDTHRLGVAQGFPEVTVRSMALDAHEQLWMATERGVLRCRFADLADWLEGRTETVATLRLDREDGLRAVECSSHQPGLLASELGEIYIPTKRGLFRVPHRDRDGSQRASVPPVMIEEVWLDQSRVWDHSMADEGVPEVTAPPGGRRVVVRYTAIHLKAPEKLRFRYRLVGLSERWTEPAKGRLLEFPGLSAGNYTVELAASTSLGSWTEEPARLLLVVQPHFWETWWFQLLSALVLLGLGAWLTHGVAAGRMRRQRLLLEKAQAVSDERRRIAEDMHDDLGARLTQIALLGEMGGVEVGGQKAFRIEEMTRTARDAAASMDELVWAVNPKNDRLSRLASYLSGYVQEYGDAVGWQTRVEVPAVLPEMQVSGKLRHHLYLLVKEVLNNAAKHAQATEVGFFLGIDAGTLRIRMEDNGRGFDPKQAALGNGLDHLHSRLRDFRGRATLESAEGEGTVVVIEIPLAAHDPST